MKRISFWITVVLSCCIFSTANAEPQCGVILDVNGDRKTGLEEAIYALQVVAGIQGQCNSKETEPNDSFSEATSVGLNEETVGKIETAGDEDYFKFTTSKAGVIEVSVEPVPSDIRLVARLYDAQQEQIDYKHASETGGIIFFKKLSDAGVHYLKLEGEYSSSKSDEPYTVQIGLDIFDSYEINNSFASASSVSLDTDVRGKALRIKKYTKSRKYDKTSGMKKINPQILKSFKSAIQKLTGYKRRIFIAELTKDYFDGSPRKAECYLGVGRKTAVLGLRELETGFVCVENFHERGRKKTEEKFGNLKNDISEIADAEGQADPKFQTDLIYLKITAGETKKMLEKKGYSPENFTERTVCNILNRQGYKLRKVRKTKPLKKNT
nr:hypothetical protein [Desulfonema ishimotonii]